MNATPYDTQSFAQPGTPATVMAERGRATNGGYNQSDRVVLLPGTSRGCLVRLQLPCGVRGRRGDALVSQSYAGRDAHGFTAQRPRWIR